jgi:segregation and condensation protein A
LSDRIDPLVVHLDRFEGPLDLLLHLIRKQDIDIFDIPISRITHQFLTVVRDVAHLELERAGDFLEMAATLIRIKAQMLFPRRSEEEDDDPRAELVRRLLEYEHFREAAELLAAAEGERGRHHGRGYVEPRAAPPIADAPLETTWDEVWSAALELSSRLAEPEPGYRVEARAVRVDEKVDYILTVLSDSQRVEFESLVAPWGTRMHAVISLLACLELAKQHAVRLRQAAPFAPVWVYRRQEEQGAA